MEAIIGALFETEMGLVILGAILMTALIINFFNNKPKI